MIKILLLGSSDSGKTTLGRQIRVLHGTSFSGNEILQFKKLIRSLCLEDLENIVVEYIATQHMSTEIAEMSMEYLNRIRRGMVDRQLIDLAISLWHDLGVNLFISQSQMNIHFAPRHIMADESLDVTSCRKDELNSEIHYQSDDPGYHFLPNFNKIMASGYDPSLSDILSIRVHTTGTNELRQ
jgi:hypothetical protein